jgi:hypothetical protein
VAGYTITIAPTDDETGAQTTIRVDTASGTTRITELTVRAVDGGGLSAQQLPSLNLDQLIAALAPPVTTAITAAPTASEPASASAGAPEPGVSQDPSAPAAAPSSRAGRPRPKKTARKTAQKDARARRGPDGVSRGRRYDGTGPLLRCTAAHRHRLASPAAQPGHARRLRQPTSRKEGLPTRCLRCRETLLY